MTPLIHPTPTVPEPGAEASATPLAGSIGRGERLQLVLAGVLWAVAAVILASRGVSWLLPLASWPALLLGGIALGALKARYILRPVARKVIERIRDRGPAAPVAGFLSIRSWVVVVLMMAGGHALRLTAAPRPVLGVLYVAIASALLIASRAYWRVHAYGWSEIEVAAARR